MLLQYAQDEPKVPLLEVLSDGQIGPVGRRWTQDILSPPSLPLPCPQLLQHANDTEGHAQIFSIHRIVKGAILILEATLESLAKSFEV